MATNYVTPVMGLTVPIPGQEPGPQYATDMSNNMSIIDGYGLPVTPARLNINADLSVQSHNLTNLRSVRMVNEGGTLVGASDLNCLYVDNGNLYFNNAAGIPIEITVGNGTAPTPLSAFTIQLDNAATWTMIAADTYNILDVAYTTTGAATINLAASNSLASGRFLIIKDAAGNASTHNITINIAGGSGDLIDSLSSLVINSNFGAVILWTDANGNWYILGNVVNVTGSNGYIHLSNTATMKAESGTTVTLDGYANLLGTNVIGGSISLTASPVFAASVTSTSLTQTVTAGAASDMSITAQGSSGSHPGGALNLSGGTSPLSRGNVNIYSGSNAILVVSETSLVNYTIPAAGGGSYEITPWYGTNDGQASAYATYLSRVKTLASGSNVAFFFGGIPVPSGTFSFIEFSWIRRSVNAAAVNSFANKASTYVSNLGGVITMGALALAYPSGTCWDVAGSLSLGTDTSYITVSAVAQSIDQYWQIVATVHTC